MAVEARALGFASRAFPIGVGTEPGGAWGWTVYAGGIFEKTFAAGGGVTGSAKYYQALGRKIAVRRDSGGGGLLSYLLTDHLGSATAALNGIGLVIPGSAVSYWPYGATRVAGDPRTDELYTGQQWEPGGDVLGRRWIAAVADHGVTNIETIR